MGGEKPTSRYLCASPDLAYFRFAGPTRDLLRHTFLLVEQLI